MLPAVVAMLVIFVVAIIVLAVVILGMQGTGRHRIPEVSHTLARAGQHLNGEAEPPRGLVALFEEAGEGAEDIRQLPGNLRRRSAASAASARSALSSRTALSARTARSAATPAPVDADPALAEEFARTSASSVVDSAWGSTEVRSAWGDEASQAPTASGPVEPARPREARSARWFRSPGRKADPSVPASPSHAPESPSSAPSPARPAASGSAAAVAAGAAAGAGSAAAVSWGQDAADHDAAASEFGIAPAGRSGADGGYELADEFSLLAGLDEETESRAEGGTSAWAVWSDEDED